MENVDSDVNHLIQYSKHCGRKPMISCSMWKNEDTEGRVATRALHRCEIAKLKP